MRPLINTDGVQFRVSGAAKPKTYKDKDEQAVTRDGEPIWTRSSPSARPRNSSGSRWLANSPG